MTIRIFCTRRSRCNWWIRMHQPQHVEIHELLMGKYDDRCPKCGGEVDAVEESQASPLSDPRD